MVEQLDDLAGDPEAHVSPPPSVIFSATIATFTRTSGSTFSSRIRGGSMPKSRTSNVDSPARSTICPFTASNVISSS